MYLREAREILKRNGYMLSEVNCSQVIKEKLKNSIATFDKINAICDKYGFEVIDSDVDPDTWVIYKKHWEDEIEKAPLFDKLIRELGTLDGFAWTDDDADRSSIVCWNKNVY